ncbi:MAG: hypothetical protein OEU36_18860 [Gammaproteobacteria bacterium]|nr:hypothetical protein [Gammaproteobacteria bacterium]
MSEQQTFFHVGYARAASTFLQKSVFPALTGIQYVPRNRFRVREKEKKRFKMDKILMSRESGQRIFSRCDDVYRVFGSRIIISLRRQDSLIASYYRLHVKRGHTTRFKRFLDLENNQGHWKTEELEFMRIIRHVENTTGQKPIVLIFEDYIQDSELYMASLCAALDCGFDREALKHKPVHKSYTDKQLRLRRQFADFFTGKDLDENKLEGKTPKYGHVVNYLKRRILLWSSAIFMLGVKFAPESWLSDEPLIDDTYLGQIREYYQADWQACVEYVAEQNQALGVKPVLNR